MGEFAAKIWFNVQRRGLLTLMLMLIFRFIQKLIPFELLIFFEKSLVEPIPNCCPKINISFKNGEYEDIRDLNIKDVALSGGVFQNRRLRKETIGKLRSSSFNVFINEKTPVNDFNISLGQYHVSCGTGRS